MNNKQRLKLPCLRETTPRTNQEVVGNSEPELTVSPRWETTYSSRNRNAQPAHLDSSLNLSFDQKKKNQKRYIRSIKDYKTKITDMDKKDHSMITKNIEDQHWMFKNPSKL